jgi:hypothetical protein
MLVLSADSHMVTAGAQAAWAHLSSADQRKKLLVHCYGISQTLDNNMLIFDAADNGVVTAGAQAAWASLSKPDQKKQLMYHFVRPAMAIPQQVKSGKLPTLLKGHDLKVEVTPAQ